MLVPMNEEQRQAVKDKRIADQDYAKNNLKTEYADQNYWIETASKYGLRLPGWWIPSSEVKYVRRACKKVEIEVTHFVDSTGFSNLSQLAEANSGWTVLSMVGLVLEFKESQNNM